jgi:hypothetical protein
MTDRRTAYRPDRRTGRPGRYRAERRTWSGTGAEAARPDTDGSARMRTAASEPTVEG